MNRLIQLEALLETIKSWRDTESHFPDLYRLLEMEMKMEKSREPDLKKNKYLNDLRQTLEKQAEEYLREKTRKKSAFKAYRSFAQHFLYDVMDGVRIYKN